MNLFHDIYFKGAPRLLQAIARDNVIPFIDVFRVTQKNGEPIRALIVTVIISELGILVGKLEYVAPVIDVYVKRIKTYLSLEDFRIICRLYL